MLHSHSTLLFVLNPFDTAVGEKASGSKEDISKEYPPSEHKFDSKKSENYVAGEELVRNNAASASAVDNTRKEESEIESEIIKGKISTVLFICIIVEPADILSMDTLN